jgi:hypothetical protein
MASAASASHHHSLGDGEPGCQKMPSLAVCCGMPSVAGHHCGVAVRGRIREAKPTGGETVPIRCLLNPG